jgi:hypothetical protein
VLDGDGVLVDAVALSGVVPQVALDEVASRLGVVRQIGLPQVVVGTGDDQLRVVRVLLRPGGVDRVDDRSVRDCDELVRIRRDWPCLAVTMIVVEPARPSLWICETSPYDAAEAIYTAAAMLCADGAGRVATTTSARSSGSI